MERAAHRGLLGSAQVVGERYERSRHGERLVGANRVRAPFEPGGQRKGRDVVVATCPSESSGTFDDLEHSGVRYVELAGPRPTERDSRPARIRVRGDGHRPIGQRK